MLKKQEEIMNNITTISTTRRIPSLTLSTHIVTVSKPSNKREVRQLFRNDPRIKGKKLISFTVELDKFETERDPYTNYHNLHADHYDITATFE